MVLALGIAGHFWSLAFPVAAVPFPLTREDVKTRLADFVGSIVPLDGCRSAMLFQESTETKNFIERQYGPARLSDAARDGVKLWYWQARWFKPGQHEEFQAAANQAGSIVGFTHVIEEERAFPELKEGEARALAEGFLRPVVKRNPTGRIIRLPGSRVPCGWGMPLIISMSRYRGTKSARTAST
jgi:hypothetical protein